ncbi:MAG TPA: hypothetical protein VEB86_06640 [Chryseosolibacter sp.]|nr:hypothetical protein [Chryseosolibacter sp.]
MKAIRSISSLLLAFLVLMSSTSFMVGVHLCSGNVRDVAIFSKAQPCPNEKPVPACHRHENPCCEDNAVVHAGEDFHGSDFKNLAPVVQPVALVTLPLLLSEIVPSVPVIGDRADQYDPPLPADDLIVEHRVLLI